MALNIGKVCYYLLGHCSLDHSDFCFQTHTHTLTLTHSHTPRHNNHSDTHSQPHLYIYYACLFVCPFVSNKRQNGWTNQAQNILCTSPGNWFMTDQNFTKLCVKVFLFLWNFEKILLNPKTFLMLFFTLYK